MSIEIRKQAHETVLLIEKIVKRSIKAFIKSIEKIRTQITITKISSDLIDVVTTSQSKFSIKRKRDDLKFEKKNKSNIEC